MKIAIPTVEGKLALHFGHCRVFTIIETDDQGNIVSAADEVPPAHQPGVLPAWLSEAGADVIIAGGMGQRAQQLFAGYGIEVVTGAQAADPQDIAKQYIDGVLETGGNICDH